MRAALALIVVMLSGCYAHMPGPGPNCNVDPNNPACFPPLTDSKKDGGADR